MADWHGYFVIDVTTPLSGPQKQAVWDDLKQLGKQSGEAWEINQVRRALDNQALLIECVLAATVTKAQVVARLATATGFTQTQINNNSTFSRFDTAAEARDYLVQNWARWEVDE